MVALTRSMLDRVLVLRRGFGNGGSQQERMRGWYVTLECFGSGQWQWDTVHLLILGNLIWLFESQKYMPRCFFHIT